MASVTEGFTSYRPKDAYVVDANNKIIVNGDVAQYLTGHQLNGINQLYRNHQKSGSTILNDEKGLGKRVQVATFIGAIWEATTSRVIIFCDDKIRVNEWLYHLAIFAPSVLAQQIDLTALNTKVPQGGIVQVAATDNIGSGHKAILSNLTCDLLVLDEADRFFTVKKMELFSKITAAGKIVMSNENIMMDLRHFFEVLKICDVLDTFSTGRTPQKISKFNDFAQKFGSYCAKGLSARDQTLRMTNMSNMCRKFYIRRQRQRVTVNLPLIEAKMYEQNIKRWQRSQAETIPYDIMTELIHETIEEDVDISREFMQSAQVFSQDMFAMSQSLEYDIDRESSERMSPLVYESEAEDLDETMTNEMEADAMDRLEPNIEDSDEITNGQTRFRSVTPSITEYEEEEQADDEMQQESTRMTRARQRQETPTTTARTRRSKTVRTAHAYKMLDLKVNSVTKKRRAAKDKQSPSKISSQSSTSSIEPPRKLTQRRISLGSEVLCISQRLPSPIYIDDSSESIFSRRNSNRKNSSKRQSTKENHDDCSSPDLFADSTPVGRTAAARTDASTVVSPTIINEPTTSQSPTDPSNSTVISELNESKDLMKTPDIFEITKNDVFHNVLRINSDSAMTPVSTQTPARLTKNQGSAGKSCFDGVRVCLPRLCLDGIGKDKEFDVAKKTVFRKTPAPGRHDLIPTIELSDSDQSITRRLPARRSLDNAFQKVSDTSHNRSEEGEKTPPRRGMPTTPTTRSCLRMTSAERMSRDGWLSKRKSPRGDSSSTSTTPTSRRRLDDSFGPSPLATTSNLAAITPRSLFELKAGRRITRSRSVAFCEHPIIVSSSDED